MLHVLGSIIGAVLTVAGLALIWTPIPVGLLLVIVGLSMLASFSPWTRERIRDFRRRHPDMSQRARGLERRMPENVRRSWEKTDPDRNDV